MINPILLDTLLVVGTLALISAFVVYKVYQFRWLESHGRQISAMVTSIRHETGKTAWAFHETIITSLRSGRILAQGEPTPFGRGL